METEKQRGENKNGPIKWVFTNDTPNACSIPQSSEELGRKCRHRQIAIIVTINLLLAFCSVVKGGDEPGRFAEGVEISLLAAKKCRGSQLDMQRA